MTSRREKKAARVRQVSHAYYQRKWDPEMWKMGFALHTGFREVNVSFYRARQQCWGKRGPRRKARWTVTFTSHHHHHVRKSFPGSCTSCFESLLRCHPPLPSKTHLTVAPPLANWKYNEVLKPRKLEELSDKRRSISKALQSSTPFTQALEEPPAHTHTL